MTYRYGRVLPDRHPIHTKYNTPHATAIQVSSKPRHESLSEQFVNLMSSRPRTQIIVYKVKSNKHHRYDNDDDSYPMYLNHVPGKQGLSRSQVARLEKRFYSPEPAARINNSISNGEHQKRYSYERERKLPPLLHGGMETYSTVSVRPALGYAPMSQSKCARPRVHWADEAWADETYAPYVMEVRQRR